MKSVVRVSVIRPSSRMPDATAVLVTLKQLRLRADRAAEYRAVTSEVKRWLLNVADDAEELAKLFPDRPRGEGSGP